MTVCVPRHFDIRVTEPPRNLLNVNSTIRKQRNMRMPKIMYADFLYSCQPCIKGILVLKRRIPQGTNGTTDSEILIEIRELPLPLFMLV